MTIKTFSITSDTDSVEFTLTSPVCIIHGNESAYLLDLIREIIGNNPYCSPEIIDDGRYVIHSDVELDGKNYALCYIRNADYVGDCRIAANFELNSTRFSLDDTNEYLRKTDKCGNDYSNVFDSMPDSRNKSIISESNRLIAEFDNFISRCKGSSDNRPIFIYDFFERIDESIDTAPYLEKLSNLGRQVFVSIPESYSLDSLEQNQAQLIQLYSFFVDNM